mgnify:CR=1 FL=1
MVLLSALGALNSKRKILEKNLENINEEIVEKCYGSDELIDEARNNTTAYYTGKYTFAGGCVTYVYKGKNFADSICVSDGTMDTITEICTSEKETIE